MFSKIDIKIEADIFNKLEESTIFENITVGRLGANLINNNNIIPLVRTTTIYRNSSQQFLPIHYDIINKIKIISKNNELNFNNAMIEIYDSKYTKMKYHTDQSLDLEQNSYICIFSCYENPLSLNIRKFKIKEKETNNYSEFLLNHGSIILFSLNTNYKHLHKIILEQNSLNAVENKWLGITFRLSKTFIQFVNEIPYFYQTNNILKFANDQNKLKFMKYKSLENKNIYFNYPEIDYTLNTSDILPIT